MVEERWLLICDGFYEVSDLGNIKRAKAGHATFIGRPLLPISSPAGYLQVSLKAGKNKAIRKYVHTVVAEAFHGPRPDGHVINHIDADKLNNAASNLEYVTRSENCRHAVRHVVRRKGPIKPVPEKVGRPSGEKHWSKIKPDRIARGNKMPHCKLTPEMVASARTRVEAGEMQKTIALE